MRCRDAMRLVLPLLLTTAAGLVLFMYGTPTTQHDKVTSTKTAKHVDHSAGRHAALGGNASTTPKATPSSTQLHATEAPVHQTHASVHEPSGVTQHAAMPLHTSQKPGKHHHKHGHHKHKHETLDDSEVVGTNL